MVNGTAATSGIAALCVHDARSQLAVALGVHALAIQALRASVQPFDGYIHRHKPHPGQQWTAQTMRTLLAGSRLTRDDGDRGRRERTSGPVQDRYSVRCLPQFVGPIVDGFSTIARQVETEINSTTDNPLIDVEGDAIHHGGNFLAQYVGLAMDQLRHHIGLLAKHLDAQIAVLVTPAFSGGLPPSLVGNTARRVNMGLKGLQISANSIMPLLGFLGQPLVDRFPTHAEQFNQNVNSLGFGAAGLARESVRTLPPLPRHRAPLRPAGRRPADGRWSRVTTTPGRALSPATVPLYEAAREVARPAARPPPQPDLGQPGPGLGRAGRPARRRPGQRGPHRRRGGAVPPDRPRRASGIVTYDVPCCSSGRWWAGATSWSSSSRRSPGPARRASCWRERRGSARHGWPRSCCDGPRLPVARRRGCGRPARRARSRSGRSPISSRVSSGRSVRSTSCGSPVTSSPAARRTARSCSASTTPTCSIPRRLRWCATSAGRTAASSSSRCAAGSRCRTPSSACGRTGRSSGSRCRRSRPARWPSCCRPCWVAGSTVRPCTGCGRPAVATRCTSASSCAAGSSPARSPRRTGCGGGRVRRSPARGWPSSSRHGSATWTCRRGAALEIVAQAEPLEAAFLDALTDAADREVLERRGLLETTLQRPAPDRAGLASVVRRGAAGDHAAVTIAGHLAPARRPARGERGAAGRRPAATGDVATGGRRRRGCHLVLGRRPPGRRPAGLPAGRTAGPGGHRLGRRLRRPGRARQRADRPGTGRRSRDAARRPRTSTPSTTGSAPRRRSVAATTCLGSLGDGVAARAVLTGALGVVSTSPWRESLLAASARLELFGGDARRAVEMVAEILERPELDHDLLGRGVAPRRPRADRERAPARRAGVLRPADPARRARLGRAARCAGTRSRRPQPVRGRVGQRPDLRRRPLVAGPPPTEHDERSRRGTWRRCLHPRVDAAGDRPDPLRGRGPRGGRRRAPRDRLLPPPLRMPRRAGPLPCPVGRHRGRRAGARRG